MAKKSRSLSPRGQYKVPVNTDRPEGEVLSLTDYMKGLETIASSDLDDPAHALQEFAKDFDKRQRGPRGYRVNGKEATRSSWAPDTRRAANEQLNNIKRDLIHRYPDRVDEIQDAVGKLKQKADADPDFEANAPAKPVDLTDLELERLKGEQKGLLQNLRDAPAGNQEITVNVTGSGDAELSPQARGKVDKRAKLRILESDVGLSRTAADRLIKLGLDPSKGPQTIDASVIKLNKPTINKLTAAGYKIKNQPGQTRRAAGASKAELRAGRLSGSGTVKGQARLAKQGGLFRRKTIYENDGRGGIRAIELEPRVTGKDLKKAAKKSTAGAVAGVFTGVAKRRQNKRLNNPYNQIRAIEDIERNERFSQLRGEWESSTGLKRKWKYTQIQVYKWTLLHRGLATFLLLAGLLFVPWIGVLTWTGWGIGALALTMLEYAALALVNVYNLLSSIVIGGISFLGNLIVGFTEFLSRGALSLWQLCDGDGCSDRLFKFTPIDLSTVDIDIVPTVPKPSHFDSRTLIDLVLGLFGIRIGIFNELLKWFRGQ